MIFDIRGKIQDKKVIDAANIIAQFFIENDKCYQSYDKFQVSWMEMLILQLKQSIVINESDNTIHCEEDMVDTFEHDITLAMLCVSLAIFIRKFFNLRSLTDMTFEQMLETVDKFDIEDPQYSKYNEVARKAVDLFKHISQSSKE